MDIPYVPAKYMGAVRSTQSIRLIVIHDMEAPKTDKTAENVARYFQTTTRPASAHYNIDNDSIVQCVPDNRVAYGAPGANANGLHFEHAGYANQSREQWLDDYSARMLFISAGLCGFKCKQYNIPPVFVNATQLRSGQAGITTHAEVTAAFRQSTHTDPGPGFPMDKYLTIVQAVVNGAPQEAGPIPPPSAPPQANPDTTNDFWQFAAKMNEWGAQQPVLTIGSSGLFVVRYQQWINIVTNTKMLATDGKFGSRTRDVTKTYQRDRGLTADGVVGQFTWGRLAIEVLARGQ